MAKRSYFRLRILRKLLFDRIYSSQLRTSNKRKSANIQNNAATTHAAYVLLALFGKMRLWARIS